MVIEKKLDLIGFTGFIHLNKNKRDDKVRKTFNSKFHDNWFSIILVKENTEWEIEEIIDDNCIIEKSLAKNKSSILISDLILFFKNHFYANSSIASIL